MEENKKSVKDARYPYTYACDFIRALAGYNEGGTKLSRSDASKIIEGIALAVGMEDRRLAELLADAEQSKSDEDRNKDIKPFLEFISRMKYSNWSYFFFWIYN